MFGSTEDSRRPRAQRIPPRRCSWKAIAISGEFNRSPFAGFQVVGFDPLTNQPIVQAVFYYDSRILDLDPPGQDMSLIDQRRINVDAFARYKIVDPLKFFQAVQTETAFRDRFGTISNGSVRDALGYAG